MYQQESPSSRTGFSEIYKNIMNYFYMFSNVSQMYSKRTDNQIVTYYIFCIWEHLRYI